MKEREWEGGSGRGSAVARPSMWKGCRGTHGMRRGTYMFEVKKGGNVAAQMPNTIPKNPKYCSNWMFVAIE